MKPSHSVLDQFPSGNYARRVSKIQSWTYFISSHVVLCLKIWTISQFWDEIQGQFQEMSVWKKVNICTFSKSSTTTATGVSLISSPYLVFNTFQCWIDEKSAFYGACDGLAVCARALWEHWGEIHLRTTHCSDCKANATKNNASLKDCINWLWYNVELHSALGFMPVSILSNCQQG